MDFDDLPPMLRVEEAARFLRVSRSTAYEETARFEHSGGTAGLPCIRIGRSVRVPRASLHDWMASQLHRDVGDPDAA